MTSYSHRRGRLIKGIPVAIAKACVRHFKAWRRRKWAPSGPVNLKQVPQGSIQTGTGEDALEACKRWVSCFATTEGSDLWDDGHVYRVKNAAQSQDVVIPHDGDDGTDYKLKKAAQFQHLVTSREGGHERMTKMLWDYVKDLDTRIESVDSTQTEKLQSDFCNLYYIASVAAQYTKGATRASYQSMLFELPFSHEKLLSASSTGAIIAFRIMRDIILGPLRGSYRVPLIFSDKYGNSDSIISIVLKVFYGVWTVDPTFLQSQDLHHIHAKLLYISLHSGDIGARLLDIPSGTIRRAAGFLHDASIVGTRADVVTLLFKRKLPTELARLIADADIGNVHPRLLTKGLNHVYSVAQWNTGDESPCSCKQQGMTAGSNTVDGPRHTCPRLVLRSSGVFGWSHYLRGWAHEHYYVSPHDHSSGSIADGTSAVNRQFGYQWCRFPLDECVGHYDDDDTSWMSSPQEAEILRREIPYIRSPMCTRPAFGVECRVS